MFILFFIAVAFVSVSSAGQAQGVNLSADEGLGARYSALSNTALGMSGGVTSLAYFPAAMNDNQHISLNLGHMSKFSNASLDHFGMIFPLDSLHTLGFALARFEADGIELNPSFPQSHNTSTFSAVDYVIIGAVSRRWGEFDAGFNIHLLYRDLDQLGVGIRGDLGLRYKFLKYFIASGLIKGAIPSSTRWESEYLEYEQTDCYLGFGTVLPSQYFYGTFNLAIQTKGLISEGAKSQAGVDGGSFVDNPVAFLLNSNAALEYSLNMGVHLRLGLPELNGRGRPSFGFGYLYRGFFSLDYSLQMHPELTNSHRIAFTFFPGRAGNFISSQWGQNQPSVPRLPLPEAGLKNQKSKALPVKPVISESQLPVSEEEIDKIEEPEEELEQLE